MAVFKKLKKSKEKGAPLPEPEPVKQLDKRVGMETYRDFFTLKNYWKAIDRKRQDAGQIFFSSAAAKQSAPPPPPKGDVEIPAAEAPTVDSRLPYPNFRELFTLKNYWKTVRRNDKDCGKMLLAKYLNQHPENKSLYAKLKNIDGATVDMSCSDPGFEAVAATYLKVFDDVINAVEEKPGDVQSACDRLSAVGKMHRTKVSSMQSSAFQEMEEPFLHMVKEVLQDRFNEKAETLFRKFFQFCLKYLLEGFSG